jgi:hypothetical protein
MSRIITVVGGTGTQGGSVLKALLAANTTTIDPKPYTIRTITRNPASPAAKALSSQGIQVLQADLANPTSLKAAFAGSHAIFAVTNFFENLPTLGVNKAMESETEFGINLANAAAQTSTLEHYIWSTLPDSKVNTGGEVVVPYYESKNAVDRYIRSSLPDLLEKTTFVWLGWYAGNMKNPIFHPFQIHGVGPSGGETYVTFVSVDPATKVPLLGDEETNAGLFVRGILESPRATLPGKTVAAVMDYMAIGDIVEAFGTAKGIRATAVQISRDDYRRLWPGLGDVMDISYSYLEVMDGKAFTSTDEAVLTREDIDIQGLVGADAAFARLPLLD